MAARYGAVPDGSAAGARPSARRAPRGRGVALASHAAAAMGMSPTKAPTASSSSATSDPGPSVQRSGLMKSTWAVSRPLNTTYPFMMKYLPAYVNTDGCADNECECGTQSRLSLLTTTRAPFEFSLHGVRAEGSNGSRWLGVGGGMGVEDLETIFGDEVGDYEAYSPWMDYATALWAPSLEPFLNLFARDSVDHLRLKWAAAPTPAAGQGTYYSIVVRIPDTLVVLELISNSTGPYDAKTIASFTSSSEPRHIFYGDDGDDSAKPPGDRGQAVEPLR